MTPIVNRKLLIAFLLVPASSMLYHVRQTIGSPGTDSGCLYKLEYSGSPGKTADLDFSLDVDLNVAM
jgi:hypothetical protein